MGTKEFNAQGMSTHAPVAINVSTADFVVTMNTIVMMAATKLIAVSVILVQ